MMSQDRTEMEREEEEVEEEEEVAEEATEEETEEETEAEVEIEVEPKPPEVEEDRTLSSPLKRLRRTSPCYEEVDLFDRPQKSWLTWLHVCVDS